MVAVLKAAMTGHVSEIGIEVDGIDINYTGELHRARYGPLTDGCR
jgi:hypothetical protein